ncbi:hypothetical protein Tco_0686328 [Tanacetum coccineum]
MNMRGNVLLYLIVNQMYNLADFVRPDNGQFCEEENETKKGCDKWGGDQIDNGQFCGEEIETKKGCDKWGGDQGYNQGGMMQEGYYEYQQVGGRQLHRENTSSSLAIVDRISPSNGVVPQSPMHTTSLANLKHQVATYSLGASYTFTSCSIELLQLLELGKLRFASAICLIEDPYCVLPRRDSVHFISWLRFVSRIGCVLSKGLHCDLLIAICLPLKTYIAFWWKETLAKFLLLCVFNSDDIQAVGSDSRPPMLDMTDYESWSQRIRLYCRGKENGLHILQSIDQGPFELETTRNTLGTTPGGGVLLGPERPRTYDDLSDNEKKRYDADVRATNIVLQGLLKDIYKLINHNIDAKAIWDNFKMVPGENINEYYVRFHKLVNDIRNIRMKMPNIQLNSKFVNNMSPEWDRHTQTDEILDNLTKQMALLAQSFRATLPQTNNQLRTLSNIRNQAIVQDGRIVVDECDAFDSDVDDEPTAQSIFMANLHEIHNEVQQANVIDSTSVDMGNSNVIPYD